ncbi:hypothetical protein Psal006b_01903 [Piscirickettsia salmonis]|uniref:Uncharacterized protein n=1 Tax=Piscirickettsia salmonis TaxID=1238 RepID=A0A1L6TB22_PISSA|nr:hypothetical protein [Piscirickettsia salmonis]ALT18333.1 hypothetical protein PSLF89_05395 [Piscirickettsia salmonis LF-89 = ATCC VR-1361]ALB22492.1 hypothetical protein KU39_1310 [Piscirickettsia salmonis]ALY02529.1 hypothetical protein AWE47_06420 [Piscirickettsia salmonis]AMA42070.1 hypothetical protein AWJ11_06565 [Piscirickettsia salmonis]AOS34541.1 hypothetical protein AVM72_03735 [Piscirickettsia salmonis]
MPINTKQSLKRFQAQDALQASGSFLKKGLPEGTNQADFIKAVNREIQIVIDGMQSIVRNNQPSASSYRGEDSVRELVALQFLPLRAMEC